MSPAHSTREASHRAAAIWWLEAKQNELVTYYAGGGDRREKARPRPVVAPLAENGSRLPEQADEHQDAEERKCD
jgi:hypothetical protein